MNYNRTNPRRSLRISQSSRRSTSGTTASTINSSEPIAQEQHQQRAKLSEAPKRYEHQPLNRDEIRLLRFEDVSEGQICFTIQHANLNELPQYYALSYVWGSPDPFSEVVFEDGSVISIGENLYEAFLLLNLHDINEFPVWIDAICINQSDNAEKSIQVQRMGDIYSSAYSVMVILGGMDDANSDLAMDVFTKVGAEAIARGCFESDSWMQRNDFDTVVGDYNPVEREDRPGTKDDLAELIFDAGWDTSSEFYIPVSAIATLFERPWWERVWVIQELVLSKTAYFIYGNKIVIAERLLAAVNIFLAGTTLLQTMLSLPKEEKQKYQSLITERIDMPFHLRNPQVQALMLYGYFVPESRLGPSFHDVFMQLFSWNHRVRATDPRDMIYGFIGIVKSQDFQISVDYSLSYTDVYTQAILELIRNRGYGVLELATEEKELSDLPSWVPDWSAISDTSALIFAVGPANDVLYSLRPNGMHVLKMPGHCRGYIESCFPAINVPALNEDQEHSTSLPFIKRYLSLLGRFCTRNSGYQGNNEQHLRACALVMLLASAYGSDAEELIDLELTKFDWLPPDGDDSLSEDIRMCRNMAGGLVALLKGDNFYDLPTEEEDAVVLEVNDAISRHFPDIPQDHVLVAQDSEDNIKHSNLILDLKQRLELHRNKITTLIQLIDVVTSFVARHTTVFITSSGHIGVSSNTISPQDEIVNVNGAASNLVFRKSYDGLYKLVGKAVLPDFGVLGSKIYRAPESWTQYSLH